MDALEFFTVLFVTLVLLYGIAWEIQIDEDKEAVFREIKNSFIQSYKQIKKYFIQIKKEIWKWLHLRSHKQK